VIVVDNGSQGDDAAAIRQRFGGKVEVIETGRNLGYAGGCNVGIRAALGQGCQFVLLLNNDARVSSDCIAQLMRAAQGLPQAGALCPKIYFAERPNIVQSTGGRVNLWTGTARQVGRGEPDMGQWETLAERDYADGACMLIARPALEAVGLLDEEYFAYWEETDWCFRAREKGFRCYYVPTAHAWHRGASSFSPSRYHFYYRRGVFMFLRKRATPLHLLTAILYHVLVLAPLFLLKNPAQAGRLAIEARALLWHLRNPVHRETIVSQR